MPNERPARGLDRSQLPATFTPETVRALGMRTARRLADPRNGILTAEEQQAFDRALREVLADSAALFGRPTRGSQPGGPLVQDPDLRRSYQRTQQRLEAQAARARRAFPQLAEAWDVDVPTDPASTPVPDVEPAAAPDDPTEPSDATDGGEDVSIGSFEAEVAETSDLLAILEQIAGIQQQQLEQQRSKLLSETRGLLFGAAVSVAVIVAGVAPLVEASPDERRLILLWTAAICVAALGAYAAIRAWQQRSG